MKRVLVPLLAIMAPAIHAQPVTVVPLDVKPGEWEIRREVENLPIDLRPVPAEMRDKFEQAIRTKDPPRIVSQTWRSCVSADEIAGVFGPPDDPSCTNTVTASTATRIDAQLKCRADGVRPVREGTFVAQAASREEVRGEIKLTMGEGGQAWTMNMRIVSKWVGDRCDGIGATGRK